MAALPLTCPHCFVSLSLGDRSLHSRCTACPRCGEAMFLAPDAARGVVAVLPPAGTSSGLLAHGIVEVVSTALSASDEKATSTESPAAASPGKAAPSARAAAAAGRRVVPEEAPASRRTARGSRKSAVGAATSGSTRADNAPVAKATSAGAGESPVAVTDGLPGTDAAGRTATPSRGWMSRLASRVTTRPALVGAAIVGLGLVGLGLVGWTLAQFGSSGRPPANDATRLANGDSTDATPRPNEDRAEPADDGGASSVAASATGGASGAGSTKGATTGSTKPDDRSPPGAPVSDAGLAPPTVADRSKPGAERVVVDPVGAADSLEPAVAEIPAGRPPTVAGAPSASTAGKEPVDVAARLRQPIARFEQIRPATARQLYELLEEMTGVRVRIDEGQDKAVAERLDRPVTIKLQATTLREILQTVSDKVGLAWSIDRETIRIGGRDAP